MFIPDWLCGLVGLGAFAVLTAQYCRKAHADRRAHRALAFAGSLADSIQKALLSGETKRASEAAAEIKRLAQQGTAVRLAGQ